MMTIAECTLHQVKFDIRVVSHLLGPLASEAISRMVLRRVADNPDNVENVVVAKVILESMVYEMSHDRKSFITSEDSIFPYFRK